MMAIAQPDTTSVLAEAQRVLASQAGTVEDGEVAKQEVEARDEGFGGGQEAKDFVDEIKVEDGHVEKK
jgi:large subunit ribosomal protein L47